MKKFIPIFVIFLLTACQATPTQDRESANQIRFNFKGAFITLSAASNNTDARISKVNGRVRELTAKGYIQIEAGTISLKFTSRPGEGLFDLLEGEAKILSTQLSPKELIEHTTYTTDRGKFLVFVKDSGEVYSVVYTGKTKKGTILIGFYSDSQHREHILNSLKGS